jgi:hypothetical protein
MCQADLSVNELFPPFREGWNPPGQAADRGKGGAPSISSRLIPPLVTPQYSANSGEDAS